MSSKYTTPEVIKSLSFVVKINGQRFLGRIDSAFDEFSFNFRFSKTRGIVDVFLKKEKKKGKEKNVRLCY